jgi:signal transduction histidine kinase
VKLVRRLSARVVITAIASGLVGVAIALVQARAGFRRGLAVSVRDAYADGACAAAPERWRLVGPGDSRTFAYDAASRASQNPAAPPLDVRLLLRLPDAADGVVWDDGLGASGRMIVRAAPSGPCALLQIEWSGRILARASVGVIAWSGSMTALTALLLGFLLVVWPLGRRTERLRRAADRLGASNGAPRSSATGDELDAALESLVAGDARIRADGELLQQRSQALARHLADVAHDVRTPLAALQLAIEQAADTSQNEAVRELLASALRDCVYLSGLTENLRLKSLLEEGWTPDRAAEAIDHGAAIEQICARARPLARRRGIEVDHALPDQRVEVAGDPVAFERALTNLVDNAVAYGEKGGHVAITLREEGDEFVVTVLDDGPGVAPDELTRLGERTFRTDAARRRDPRGSGLGLSITAELCARSGWTLRFEPLAPRGLQVSLRGPAASAR